MDEGDGDANERGYEIMAAVNQARSKKAVVSMMIAAWKIERTKDDAVDKKIFKSCE